MTTFLSFALVVLAALASTDAFSPLNSKSNFKTELAATSDRRNVLGSIGLALGGIAAAAATSHEGPTLLAGLKNPALELSLIHI